METDQPDSEQQLAHLRALAAALTALGLAAEVRGTETGSPEIRAAAGAGPAALRERITCRPAPGKGWQFSWPWGQPIGPADDPAAAAATIAGVMRPVEGPT